MPFIVSYQKPSAHLAPSVAPMLVDPPPLESPMYVVHSAIILPRSATDPVLNILDY